jgi:hypothetical protein
MTTCLSSLFSPAYGLDEEEEPFSMETWWGTDNTPIALVRPDGVFEVPISSSR